MLVDLHNPDPSGAEIKVSQITEDEPFRDSLEYTCPSRGTWTITHTANLVPGAHQIYVGASACLRGVVLSAAEYEGLDRYSMVMIEERDILSGDMEELFIEGISDIIDKLPRRPTAVLGFTGCIHHFLATDVDYIYDTLNERYPDIDFIRCYMIPTMQKNEVTPEEFIRSQIYGGLRPGEQDPRSVNMIGSNTAITPNSDHMKLLTDNGYTVRDICKCITYPEYKEMNKGSLNIYSMPVTAYGAADLKKRLGQDNIYMPYTWNMDEIDEDMNKLARRLGISIKPGYLEGRRAQAEAALDSARQKLDGAPVVIDMSSTTCFFSLARLLLSHGFNVTMIYGDVVMPDDHGALKWLQENYPDLPLRATKNFKSRFFPRNAATLAGGRLLAIGQKAAYFSGTTHMVNMIENNGWYGYEAIIRLCGEMEDAMDREDDVKSIIQVKGFGCSA